MCNPGPQTSKHPARKKSKILSKRRSKCVKESGRLTPCVGQLVERKQNLSSTSWILNSLVPSLLSCCAYRLLGSSPVISFILYPILQASISALLSNSRSSVTSLLPVNPLSRMQSALSALYRFAVPTSTPPQESGCAGLLRELLVNQAGIVDLSFC